MQTEPNNDEYQEVVTFGVEVIRDELAAIYGERKTRIAFHGMEEALSTIATEATRHQVSLSEVMDIFVLIVNAMEQLKIHFIKPEMGKQ